MKYLTLILVSLSAVSVFAQQHSFNLEQGLGGHQTLIIIQKNLTTIGHDKELPSINVVHVSQDERCRISSKSQELKAGEKYHLGMIYHSSSAPQTTLELVSVDNKKVAAIECDSMSDDAGINIYNNVLGDAVLMTND